MSIGDKKKLSTPFVAIGKRIAEIRGSRTKAEVARVWGIPAQYVGRYESGEVMPGGEILLKIAEKENVNINWLLKGFGRAYDSNGVVREAPVTYNVRKRTDSIGIGPVQMDMLRELSAADIRTVEELKKMIDIVKTLTNKLKDK